MRNQSMIPNLNKENTSYALGSGTTVYITKLPSRVSLYELSKYIKYELISKVSHFDLVISDLNIHILYNNARIDDCASCAFISCIFDTVYNSHTMSSYFVDCKVLNKQLKKHMSSNNIKANLYNYINNQRVKDYLYTCIL